MLPPKVATPLPSPKWTATPSKTKALCHHRPAGRHPPKLLHRRHRPLPALRHCLAGKRNMPTVPYKRMKKMWTIRSGGCSVSPMPSRTSCRHAKMGARTVADASFSFSMEARMAMTLIDCHVKTCLSLSPHYIYIDICLSIFLTHAIMGRQEKSGGET